MEAPEQGNREHSNSKEQMREYPVRVVFFKLGGTWDMVETPRGMMGSGNLDDNEIGRIESELGLTKCFSKKEINAKEKALAQVIYSRFKNTAPETYSAGEHFSSWCPDFKGLADGPFIALYSGDSVHLRPALTAPMVCVLIEQAIKDPHAAILAAQGTDTADIAVMSLIDALVFDTPLPPFILTGANRSHRESDSDAPKNFRNLAKIAGIDFRPDFFYHHFYYHSGAFWLFDDNLFTAADLIKFNPKETRPIEGQSTFFSPNRRNYSLDEISGDGGFIEDPRYVWKKCIAPPKEHITQKLRMEALYNALNRVYTVDLGNQNRLSDEVNQILNPTNKVIVVAAHSLGNSNNIIRSACVEAAKRGKIVVASSRALIDDINDRYASSLLDANRNPNELGHTNHQIIPGYQLNKTVARSLGVRAILENLNQEKTQHLFQRYYYGRFPNPRDYMSRDETLGVKLP